MFKHASFECSVLAVRVTVFRQSFTSSGIGNSATAVTARLQLLARELLQPPYDGRVPRPAAERERLVCFSLSGFCAQSVARV